MLTELIDTEISQVGREALKEGREAKTRAEKETGLVIDIPDLHFEVYNRIRKARWRRREELKLLLLVSGVQDEDISEIQAREEMERQERRRIRREKRAERRATRRMAKEEWETRTFLLEETRLMIRESRLMIQAEVHTAASWCLALN